MKTNPSQAHDRQEGSVLLLSLVALFVLFLLGSIVAGTLARSLHQTRVEIQRVKGFNSAEAALNRGVFYVEAKLSDTYGNSWEQFCAKELYPNLTSPATITGTLDGVPYEFWFEDNEDEDGKTAQGLPIIDQSKDRDGLIWVYARSFPAPGMPKTARGIIARPPAPKALDYSLFGNFVHFDNHNGAPFGVIMTTTVWSNSIVKVDSAIEIAGQITAVEEVQLNSGPRGNKVPFTIVNPPPLQGDAGASAPVQTVVPAPNIKAFPILNLAAAKAVAQAHGTYFASSNAFLSYLKDPSRTQTFTQTYGPPEDIRYIRVPHKSDLDQRFPLGDEDGNMLIDAGEDFEYTVYTIKAQNVNDFAYNNVYYVENGITLSTDIDEMVHIEGSLITDGSISISCGGEILAYHERDCVDPASILVDITPGDANRISLLDGNGDGIEDSLVDLDGDGSVYDFRNADPVTLGTKDEHYSNWPAIAAENGINIKGGNSGPIHIEGAIYTAGQSHFHRSDPQGKAFVCGNEIADTVHNCEFISFFYDIEVQNTIDFTEKLTGRPDLALLNFDEDAPVAGLPALSSINVGTGNP